MKKIIQIGTWIIWFLQGILTMLLIFQERFTTPIERIGHLHPLILHLPIGLGFLLVVLLLLKKEIESFDFIFQFILLITSFFASLTVIFGLFLSKEGGFDTNSLSWHQWSGVAIAFLYFILINWKKYSSWGVGIAFLVLMLAGHTGATITHGEGYLSMGKQEQVINQESIAFEVLVQPIIKNKCESCHNDQKSKGGLKMNSITNLLKGGKNGPIWKPGDVLNSHMMQRINLPLDAKKHMPPAGKVQLTKEEQLILSLWIKDGAKLDKAIGKYSKEFQQIAEFKSPTSEEKTYPFSAASESDIESVNTPFCTVYPIANESPALQAEFFVAAKYDPKILENLQKVGEQLIGINLNKMPVSDSEMAILNKFTNLEKLYLNGSKITDKGLLELKNLPHLKEISLSSTTVGSKGIRQFIAQIPSIQKIFIWNAGIQETEIANLRIKYPKIQLEQGFIPKNETLQINPPILVNERLFLKPNEELGFKHTIKDVVFKYTVNDSLPDSLSSLSTKAIVPIKNFTKVRIIATKPGWYASNPIDVKVYKSKFVPQKIDLLSPPASNYPAKGGFSLMDFEQGLREVKGVPNLTWLGFKEGDLDALASFPLATKINGITLSYLEKSDSDVFPPNLIEVFAGNDPKQMKLLSKVIPKQPKEKSGFSTKGINIPIQTNAYSYYRIKAHRLKKLPNFVDNKGKGAWLKVDELLFY